MSQRACPPFAIAAAKFFGRPRTSPRRRRLAQRISLPWRQANTLGGYFPALGMMPHLFTWAAGAIAIVVGIGLTGPPRRSRQGKRHDESVRRHVAACTG